MNVEWSKPTKYIVGVGLVLFSFYVLYLSSSVVTLLIIATLISFLLMPVVDFLRYRLRMPRRLAVLFSFILLGLVIMLAPLIFITPAIEGFTFLAELDHQILIRGTLASIENTLVGWQEVQQFPLGITINLNPIVTPTLEAFRASNTSFTPTLPSFDTMMTSFQSAATITYGVATNVAGTVFSGVLTFIITLISTVYISLDGHKFAGWFMTKVPQTYRPEVAQLFKRLSKTWRAYFLGQLNLMIIIGVITWLGNTAIGLPGAFSLGVIAGVMELIPALGPFLALVPAMTVALIQGSTYLPVSNFVFVLIVIGLYVIIQQVENTFVVPRVLGGAVGLHPLVVILGVVIGANVAGILGALLAAPVIASTKEIFGYLYAKILSEAPFPPQAEEPEVVPVPAWPTPSLLRAKGRQFIERMSRAPRSETEPTQADDADSVEDVAQEVSEET